VKFGFRVNYNNEEFYPTLKITADQTVIFPEDDDKDRIILLLFTESRLEGCSQLATTNKTHLRGIELKFKNKTCVQDSIQQMADRNRALNAFGT
jgi:hypothetical protein